MATKNAYNLALVYAGVAVSNFLHLVQLWQILGKSHSLIYIIPLFIIATLALTVLLAVYDSRGTKEARDWLALSLEVLLLAEGITIEVRNSHIHSSLQLTNLAQYIVTIWALVKEYSWKKRWGVIITAILQLIITTVLFAIRNLQGIFAIPIISHCLSCFLLSAGALHMHLDHHGAPHRLRQDLWVAFSFVILAISVVFYAWGSSGRFDLLFPAQYFCTITWTMAGVYRQIRVRRMVEESQR